MVMPTMVMVIVVMGNTMVMMMMMTLIMMGMMLMLILPVMRDNDGGDGESEDDGDAAATAEDGKYHWLLNMWRKYTNALFFFYNNSLEHLLKTGQLNAELESRPALSQTPTYLWHSSASLRPGVVLEV